jgi:hypothetical protein
MLAVGQGAEDSRMAVFLGGESVSGVEGRKKMAESREK